MNMKTILLSTVLAASLSWNADAAMNEDCSDGDIVGGRQTQRDDGKALFFDLLINQYGGGQCTLHVAIDTPTNNVSDWLAYVTDEQIDLSNEKIVNQVLSGSFKVTVPGQSAEAYVRLQRVDDGYVWDFPVIMLNARQ